MAMQPNALSGPLDAVLKPRLLLVGHVDWGHIRQRPHHLAAGLGTRFDVTVVTPLSRKRASLVTNPARGVNVAYVLRFPGSYRNAAIARINARIARIQCSPRVREAVAVVVTSPELWPWVAAGIGRRPLVYDCMDDALAFDQDEGVRQQKSRWERELLERADWVVGACVLFATRMADRGARSDRLQVVQNGWDPAAFPIQAPSTLPATGPLVLAYFGTIAPWLDVDALRAVVMRCPEVSIRLIGPVEGTMPPLPPRVAIEPPWPHDVLAAAVADAHALLLPFHVDNLTRAVDPVKLYEYVALGKPVAASYWPALDRFRPYVTFYRSPEHLAELVHARALGAPPGTATRASFLKPQSWQARAETLAAAIDGLRGGLQKS
jgi:hypothetical protein